MRVTASLALWAVVLTAGCNGGQSLNELSQAPQEVPQTIQASIMRGEQFNALYLQRGQSFRSNRTWLSLGVLAANTFVLAASGLEAHPDSIFAGALVGSTIHNVDPIVNAGGPDAWAGAHGRNVCVTVVAGGLNTLSILRDVALLKANASNATVIPVLQRYETYPSALYGAMTEIYGRYLRDTVPELPDVNGVANAAVNERTKAAAGAAPEPAPEGGMTFMMLETSIRQLAASIPANELPGAVARVTAALEFADTELPKCRPPPLTTTPPQQPAGDGGGDGT